MHCIDQNGRGPWITGVLTMIDAAVECFRFDSAAYFRNQHRQSEWMVTLADYPDLTGYGIISTTNFQGKARFFNAPLWGGREWDYVIQGGDVASKWRTWIIKRLWQQGGWRRAASHQCRTGRPTRRRIHGAIQFRQCRRAGKAF